MEISGKQLNTLMYWAKVGVSGYAPHAKKYSEKFPNRANPYIKIHNIEMSIISTKIKDK